MISYWIKPKIWMYETEFHVDDSENVYIGEGLTFGETHHINLTSSCGEQEHHQEEMDAT